MSDKQFVFMVLEEHPYGREMLMQIMNAGHYPMAIIEETSDIAEEEKGKFLERIKGHRVAPTFTELLEGKDIQRYKVPHHNKKTCRQLLQELNPDLGVLGGTRIIRDRILSIPPEGMLNAHPAWARRSPSACSVRARRMSCVCPAHARACPTHAPRARLTHAQRVPSA